MGNASLKAYNEATIDGKVYEFKFTFKNIFHNPSYVTDKANNQCLLSMSQGSPLELRQNFTKVFVGDVDPKKPDDGTLLFVCQMSKRTLSTTEYDLFRTVPQYDGQAPAEGVKDKKEKEDENLQYYHFGKVVNKRNFTAAECSLYVTTKDGEKISITSEKLAGPRVLFVVRDTEKNIICKGKDEWGKINGEMKKSVNTFFLSDELTPVGRDLPDLERGLMQIMMSTLGGQESATVGALAGAGVV